jgi:hypothetical protein
LSGIGGNHDGAVPYDAAAWTRHWPDQITSNRHLQAFLAARRIAGGSLQCRRKFARPRRYAMPGNRNILFLIIGALIVVVAVLGYNVYQSKKQPEGLQINLGPNGLKIENK